MTHAFIKRLIAAVCSVVVCAGTVSGADDAAARARIRALVQRERPAALELIEQAVNINSGTLNFAGVQQTAALFRERFTPLGFAASWLDGDAFGRAGHLVLHRAGKGPRVLLIGHLDTVFDRAHPFQLATRLDANTLRGPGTADMKGGIVVALTALRALAALDALDGLDLTIMLNGDEEDAGEPLTAARAALVEAAQRADVALGLENAADDPRTAVVARRSSSQWQLQVQARTAHSSRIFSPEVGAGASYELARVLNGFYTQLHQQPNLTFNAAVVLSGSQLEFDTTAVRGAATGKNNIVPDRAVVSGDLRALTPEQLQNAVTAMEGIAAQSLPQTRSTLRFTHNYPPMPPSAGNDDLLALYDRASRDLGHGPVMALDPARAGAADISFAARYVPMNLDGLGLLGGKAHTAEEFADLRTFNIQAERLALLLYRLSRDGLPR